MITDVIDDAEVRNGVREDGTIYAVYSFARKIGQALSSGLVGGLLTMVGYTQETAFDPEVAVSGVLGNAGQANYAASKAGIIGLTKTMARELASRGITVNAIAPGFINTEMTEVLSDSVKEAAVAQIPLKRFGETKDIAEMAAFLASDKADYITGQVIHVDGGMAM